MSVAGTEGAWAALARHPRRVDAALAALVAAFSVPGALAGTGPAAWAWFAAPHVALVWRRQAPVAACWLVLVLVVPGIAVGVSVEGFYPELVAAVALYTAARYGPLPQLVPIVVAIAVPVGLTVALEGWTRSAFGFATSMTAATVLLGLTVRTRQAYLGQLADRAVGVEREREQELRLVAAGERARIARDLHDIVAHNLAVMIALADGAAVTAATSPERAAAAMTTVSATGRQALGEMRRLLGVLDDGAADGTAPQPGLDDVPALVEQVRSAGLRVDLEVDGEPGPSGVGVGAGLAAYRIVQEALTNTLKHAGPGATAEVRVRYAGDDVEVQVTDDGGGDGGGGGASGRTPVDADGRGVAGMAERATAYGGRLVAGPRPDGAGWRVRARLRLATEPAAEEGSVEEGSRA